MHDLVNRWNKLVRFTFFLCMSSAELHQKHLLLLPMLKTAFAAFCGYIHYTAVQTFGVTEIKKYIKNKRKNLYK